MVAIASGRITDATNFFAWYDAELNLKALN